VGLCPGYCNAGANGDSDGIGDGCDLCVHLDDSQPPEIDSDGIGNACDANDNNDDFVNASDFSLFLGCLQGNAAPAGSDCAKADANGDGFVDSTDFSSFLAQLTAGVPGQSGLDCADSAAQGLPCHSMRDNVASDWAVL
jgi:hypothetical protein